MNLSFFKSKLNFSSGKSTLQFLFTAIFISFILISCLVICILAATAILNTGENLGVERGLLAVEKSIDYINADDFQRLCLTEDANDPYYENVRQWLFLNKAICRL